MREQDTVRAREEGNDSLCVLCFDYEKILIAPRGFTSAFYYKTKLAINNFTVADAGRNQGTRYVYDETTAKKGGNEVASLLLHYVSKKEENPNLQGIHSYSDNCPGQNKNKHFGSYLNYVATKCEIKIIHRYLEKGHTYNAADQFHSLIERRSKNQTLYTPNDWYNLMRKASRVKSKPLIVIKSLKI